MSLSRPAWMAPVRIEIACLHFGCASANGPWSQVTLSRMLLHATPYRNPVQFCQLLAIERSRLF